MIISRLVGTLELPLEKKESSKTELEEVVTVFPLYSSVITMSKVLLSALPSVTLSLKSLPAIDRKCTERVLPGPALKTYKIEQFIIQSNLYEGLTGPSGTVTAI